MTVLRVLRVPKALRLPGTRASGHGPANPHVNPNRSKIIHSNATPLLAAAFCAGALTTSAQGGFVLFGDAAPAPEPAHKVVRPLTAPYFHEDAFVTSDLRAWYVNHQFYGDTIGGEAEVYALQVRLALTKRLQLVAYKDGYTDLSDTGLGNPDGWNGLGAGLKYAVIQDWENQFHLAGGIGYELGLGDAEVLQDTDELRLWLSANKGFDRLHLGFAANYRVADNHRDGPFGAADMVTLHAHADYFVNDWFSPVVELNGYFVTDEGPVGADFSGVDAVSIGGGEDEATLTGALGAELRPLGPGLGLRLAYETELTDNVSLFGHRWTFSTVYEF